MRTALFLSSVLFALLPLLARASFPIHDVCSRERVAYRRNGVLVTEGNDAEDLEGNTIPESRFRVLRFDKGTGQRHIESAVSCGPSNATSSKGGADAGALRGAMTGQNDPLLFASHDVDKCLDHKCSGHTLDGRLLYSYIHTQVSGALGARALTATGKGKADFLRVLVVGMGAGMIPLYLSSILPREAKITAIEMDPTVIEASRHCFFAGAFPFEAVQGEGRAWVEKAAAGGNGGGNGAGGGGGGAARKGAAPQDPFDLVLIDAFTPANVIPRCLTTHDFLATLSGKLLRPGGVVAINTWGQDKDSRFDKYVATFQSTFANVFIGNSPGLANRIIIGHDDSVTSLRPSPRFKETAASLVAASALGDDDDLEAGLPRIVEDGSTTGQDPQPKQQQQQQQQQGAAGAVVAALNSGGDQSSGAGATAAAAAAGSQDEASGKAFDVAAAASALVSRGFPTNVVETLSTWATAAAYKRVPAQQPDMRQPATNDKDADVQCVCPPHASVCTSK